MAALQLPRPGPPSAFPIASTWQDRRWLPAIPAIPTIPATPAQRLRGNGSSLNRSLWKASRKCVARNVGALPKDGASNSTTTTNTTTTTTKEMRQKQGSHNIDIVDFKRRNFTLASFVNLVFAFSSDAFPAKALGDSSVNLEDVTRDVAEARKLSPLEEATIEIFDRSTFSVVNIFDVSLRPQVNLTGSVEIPEGNGSGIVWDDKGNIVTNYHVISNSMQLGVAPGKVVSKVVLLTPNGFQKSFEGTLVGADKSNDLAVINVNAPPELLRSLPLGKNIGLRVGQKVLAIGNPFGFDHTLTTGVVSGLNRDIYSQTGVVIGGGIQTDAAINPGNSGGPLLDSKGNLIGINTAIFTRTGTSAGVGFAIPVSTVIRVVPQLIAYGKVIRPGLNVQLATDPIAKNLGVKSGALILSVPEGTNAFRAGLVPTKRGLPGSITLGDIIVGINDSNVKLPADVGKILDTLNVGDTVTLKVLRKEELVEIPIVLEESAK